MTKFEKIYLDYLQHQNELRKLVDIGVKVKNTKTKKDELKKLSGAKLWDKAQMFDKNEIIHLQSICTTQDDKDSFEILKDINNKWRKKYLTFLINRYLPKTDKLEIFLNDKVSTVNIIRITKNGVVIELDRKPTLICKSIIIDSFIEQKLNLHLLKKYISDYAKERK